MAYSGPETTDTVTLIPFLKSMDDSLDFKYKKIVADAGYESEENYVYSEKVGKYLLLSPPITKYLKRKSTKEYWHYSKYAIL